MSHHILLKTNSRLGAKKFPISGPWELARNHLICLEFFGAKTALFGRNRKYTRFYGNNRLSRPTAKRGSGTLTGHLDEDVDAAGGLNEFAPGLLVDRHAVREALGAGQTLGVARDQDRLVRMSRR